MTRLSADEREAILHSLGLDYRKRWSDRNISIGRDEVCDTLTDRGYMAKGRCSSEIFPSTFYRVTDAGAKAAGVMHKVRLKHRIGG